MEDKISRVPVTDEMYRQVQMQRRPKTAGLGLAEVAGYFLIVVFTVAILYMIFEPATH